MNTFVVIYFYIFQMIKRIFFLLAIIIFLKSTNTIVFADDIGKDNYCTPVRDTCCSNSPTQATDPNFGTCVKDNSFSCQFVEKDANGKQLYKCLPSSVGKAFGKIDAPSPLAEFLQRDPTGAGALSQFLSNLIALIFAIATIVLVLMIIWGAFDWLISEGDKEKISGAQKKIINALIGFVLLAIAFAILRIFGQFTGFTFFKGQNDPPFIQNRGPASGMRP